MVGPLEADAAAGHLSLASPLGKALLGRAVGDRLQVQTPRGMRAVPGSGNSPEQVWNDAAHVHQHRFEGSRRRLQLAFWTQLAFFVVELGGGILTNSLALLADAGHMLSDVGALGLSLLALKWATRLPTAQKTFGYHRLEILVALINVWSFWVMAGYIFFAGRAAAFSSRRLSAAARSSSSPAWGLLVNLFGMYVLLPTREAEHQSPVGVHPSAVRLLCLLCRGGSRAGHLVAGLVLVSIPWPASSSG